MIMYCLAEASHAYVRVSKGGEQIRVSHCYWLQSAGTLLTYVAQTGTWLLKVVSGDKSTLVQYSPGAKQQDTLCCLSITGAQSWRMAWKLQTGE